MRFDKEFSLGVDLVSSEDFFASVITEWTDAHNDSFNHQLA